MSPGWLLLGLLAIAFIGSNVARGRGVRGFGLPSGSEWILSGIALGPHVLDLVRPRDLHLFSPIWAAGLGWVALTIGMRFGFCFRPTLQQEVRAPSSSLGLGVGWGLATACALAVATDFLLREFGEFPPRLRVGTACWVGCSLSGSARQLVDWAKQRHGASGTTTDGVDGAFGGGEVIALACTAPLGVVLFSGATDPKDLAWRAALPVVIGLLLGLIALWLLHFEVRVAETWGILLGVHLLSAGLSLRAGSSVIGVGFFLGWLLGRDQRAGAELRFMTRPAEGTVLLPLLVVAGASLQLQEVGRLGWIVAIVLGLRFVTKLVLAWSTHSILVGARLPATALGLGLASAGEVACLVALEYTLSAPGQLGQFVLACAIVASLFGELYGAVGIRRTLAAVGELSSTDGSSNVGDDRAAASDSTGWL